MTVAKTIAEQIKLNRVLAMFGAKAYSTENSLVINQIKGSPKKVKAVEITLDRANDLYNVVSYNSKCKVVAELKGCYWDMLNETLESQTGLATSL